MTEDARLAIDGGTPACPQFRGPTFPGAEVIGDEEEAAVVRVIRSRRLFRHYGMEFPPPVSENTQFEQEFARRMGATSALAVASGTSALQAAVAALKLGPGDEVLVPAFTFIATASAVVLAGGVPVIVDIDDTLGMNPEDIERRITKRTRAVIGVHMRGGACDAPRIKEVTDRHGLPFIEDVAQAAGVSIAGRPAGSIGSLGCFSFQYQKAITSGEGGAITAGDAGLFELASMFSDTVSWLRPDSRIPPSEFMLGMNARMSELCAAVMRAQLVKLDGIVSRGKARQRALKDVVRETIGHEGLFRATVDPESDIGSCLILCLPERSHADFVAKALQAEVVMANRLFDPDANDPRAGSAVYCGWVPIVAKRSWHADGSPWSHASAKLDYSAAAHPESVDLLARCVQIDIHGTAPDEHFAGLAHALRKVLSDSRAGARVPGAGRNGSR